jgi:hypothetical protein
MTSESWARLEIVPSILIPLGSGIGWLIWKQSQNQLKLDLIWESFTNHGSQLTGYKPGDELASRKNIR